MTDIFMLRFTINTYLAQLLINAGRINLLSVIYAPSYFSFNINHSLSWFIFPEQAACQNRSTPADTVALIEFYAFNYCCLYYEELNIIINFSKTRFLVTLVLRIVSQKSFRMIPMSLGCLINNLSAILNLPLNQTQNEGIKSSNPHVYTKYQLKGLRLTGFKFICKI